jgi:hypothetical protein
MAFPFFLFCITNKIITTDTQNDNKSLPSLSSFRLLLFLLLLGLKGLNLQHFFENLLFNRVFFEGCVCDGSGKLLVLLTKSCAF